MELGKKDDEQMAVRHADSSGCDITENQHEESIMRDTHIGKRGQETANEEQPDKLRRLVRSEQDDPSTPTSSSSATAVSLEYLATGEGQVRSVPVFVHSSGHFDDEMQTSAKDVLCEMGGRESRHIKEVLAWYREGDTGDLKRNEMNELVGSMTYLGKVTPEHRDG